MSNKPRRPWIAALLTFLIRGLGHLYAGYPKRGLILFGIEQLLIVSLMSAVVTVPSLFTMLFALGGVLAYIIFCIVDASSFAKKNKENYELAKFNRWFVYVGYYIVFGLLISMLVSFAIRASVVQAYKIPSGAMIPTLLVGDHMLVNKFIYKTTAPKRGDIIIFPYPEDPSRDFVKRLIAVEGDVIEIRDKRLFINGIEQSEPYKINTDSGGPREQRDNFGPFTVPPGKLFFMGDNRDQSYDSHGVVPKDTLIGKVIILYWSWDQVHQVVRWDRIGKLIK